MSRAQAAYNGSSCAPSPMAAHYLAPLPLDYSRAQHNALHHADDSCDDARGEQADCHEGDQSGHDGIPQLGWLLATARPN